MAQPHKDYSHVPLAKKLGIKEESSVLIVDAPEGFDETLGPLPPGAELVSGTADPLDVVILFATREESYAARFAGLRDAIAPAGGLWVAWPKKSSKIPNDLSFEVVQSIGLAAGLVDNKSCAVDQDWQAARFVVRKIDRPT